MHDSKVKIQNQLQLQKKVAASDRSVRVQNSNINKADGVQKATGLDRLLLIQDTAGWVIIKSLITTVYPAA